MGRGNPAPCVLWGVAMRLVNHIERHLQNTDTKTNRHCKRANSIRLY